jgi:GNAT superfamily N-acetyltransferase
MSTVPSAAFVRPATASDAPALSVLLRELDTFARLAAEPEAATRERVHRHLDLCLRDTSHSVFVAPDSAGRLLGYTAVHWLPYLFLAGPEGFVSELFVHPEARGRRLGSALLRTVEDEARSRGCARLHLVNFRDRASYRRGFYPKAGWHERPDGASFVKALV